MAKVKIRLGQGEVEVDSRDFYVDNQSIGRVIDEISVRLRENSGGGAPQHGGAAAAADPAGGADPRGAPGGGAGCLSCLDEAEVREPEFGGPVHISGPETASRLEALGQDAFFDSPRTVAETVSQLRECGWVASPLEVSKTLTRMAIRRELTRDSQDRLNYYRRGGPIGSPVQTRTPGTS